MLLKPRRLRKGDWVAVVAPAGPVPEARLQQGLRELERWGLRVRLGAGVLSQTGYLAGDDRTRVVDLLALWAHPDVRAVFCARGGYGTARIVDALTPAFLRRHPKILCGFSDITTLHAACTRAGLVSFHGPMVAWDLAHGPAAQPRGTRARALARAVGKSRTGGYDAASFEAVLFEGRAGYRIAPTAAETLVRGRARGRLAGGCLSLLVATIGTPEELDPRGKILLLEDEMEPPYRIDRMLTQMRRAGLFRGVRGIVLGDFPECHPDRAAGYTLADVLKDRLGDLGVPVVWRFPYGHTARPNLTLPLGVRVTLDATRRTLTLDEAGVR
ncbi:MAG: S66 peptidase family protein [Candidatus Eiseniibacteriota bacterium]